MIIISDGEPGVGHLALQIAKSKGFTTRGVGRLGYCDIHNFNLIAHPETRSVDSLMKANMDLSDGTIIFQGDSCPRSCLAYISVCKMYRHRHLINPSAEEIINWVEANKITNLHIVGSNIIHTIPKRMDEIRITISTTLDLLN